MSKAFELVKATYRDFSDDGCPKMAAALSYYSVFSLPPLLILILSLVGIFVDPAVARGRIVQEVEGLLGSDGGQLVSTLITQANQPGTGIMALVGIGALLLGATGAFIQLQEALNTAWEVKPDPKRGGIKSFVVKRVLSFGMIIVIAFFLLISLVVAALVSALGDMLRGMLGGAGETIGQSIQLLLGFGITWLLFAIMFKFMPDARISWRDVWLGAFVTALLFNVGRFAIGLYLGNNVSLHAFGAATALAVLFVWIYYAANILLLGVEFTQVWATRHGRSIEPEPGAIRMDQAAHAKPA